MSLVFDLMTMRNRHKMAFRRLQPTLEHRETVDVPGLARAGQGPILLSLSGPQELISCVCE